MTRTAAIAAVVALALFAALGLVAWGGGASDDATRLDVDATPSERVEP